MDKRVVGALLQIALVVVGVPVVYVLAFPLEFTVKSFLPPVGLIVGLTTGGAMVRKTNQPVSGPLTGWLIFGACVALAFAL